MKKSLKILFSVILTVAMLLAVMLPAFAAVDTVSGRKSLSIEKVENTLGVKRARSAVSQLTEAQLKGDVRVSIVLSDKATLESGFPTKAIASNKKAVSYRESLLSKQNALANKISKEILQGKKLDVKWNLTLAANIISANVPADSIPLIESLKEVDKVVIERRYEPCVSVETDAEPNMTNASGMTGASAAWATGYTGAGSKVAIIDTGIDTDHISFDAGAFDYAIEETGKDVDLLTADEVAELYSQLNIASAIEDAGNDVYLTSKIPFAANYIDEDLDVTHDNDDEGEHGSHVAGIAAANRFVAGEDGEYENALESVLTQGNAPDAQILVMKVFGKGGGAYDSDYMAAIEDAVVLGADSVNLSLGSAEAGFATDETYQEILDNFKNYNTVVSISAGNSGTWYENSNYGVLFGEENNFDTVGSPGSFANAFTVASVDNNGTTGAYIKAEDQLIFYSETSGYGNEPLVSVAGEYEFVYIDSVGRPEEFSAVSEELEGKVAVCNRGKTSFFEKANAAVESGAVATVIANNQPGVINMNLTGYLYSAPAVSILLSDGEFLKSIAADSGSFDCEYYDADEDDSFEETVDYYTGTLTISDSAVVNPGGDVDYYTMSSFSSYGVPGDLSLKPEITAPGGNIYSVNGAVDGGEAYENMSGTSMAAPQIAGLSAVMAQYIRENDLEAKTGLTTRQLTQSLLMSTAKPLLDEYEYYYSVFQQGAGLVDVNGALSAKSYILMNDGDYASDGKVKAELGDDPERTGVYSVSFTINNFSDEDVNYALDADFFTQYMYNIGLWLRDSSTDDLYSIVTWYVNGEELDDHAGMEYDFNGDGLSNSADAEYLLSYVVGTVDSIENEEYADFDGDADIDTYDAYQILNYLNAVTVNAPAGESVEVTAEIYLPFGVYEYSYLADYGTEYVGVDDVNGNYIEGYIYIDEVDSLDGAIGATHSIPVLGYYGGWTEASMTDRGYALDSYYDVEDYTYNDELQGFMVKYSGEREEYFFGGNPITLEEEYHPERNSINGAKGDMITGYNASLIRNVAGSRVTVTDAEGNDLVEPIYGPAKYGSFYYTNEGKWYNLSTTTDIGYSPSDLEEGDEIIFTVSYAPEYYVNEDGEIDWDALGEGASESINAIVDNTDPEISDVYFEGYDPATLSWDSINVEAKDNRYIAAVILYDSDGRVIDIGGPDFEAEEGDDYFYSVTPETVLENVWSEELPTKYYIQVCDYAANVVTYKVNLDAEDLAGDLAIDLQEQATLVVNNTLALSYEVLPWGVDETVYWSSSDESVATVDENGIVKGVGEGECDIIAVCALDESVTASCHVLVKYINKDLNAAVWDENGEVWLSAFNTASLPYYEKLTEESLNTPIEAITYGGDGNLYAASIDTDELLSDLYIIDPETFDLIRVGGSDEISYMDLAPEFAFGGQFIYAVYGPYFVIVDPSSGDYYGVFDLSDELGYANLVGIAYEETYIDEEDPTDVTDYYFLLDDFGELYEIGVGPWQGSFGRTNLYDCGNVEYYTDAPYFNSLYFDGESLFWSRYADDATDIINVNLDWDTYEIDEVFQLGYFADSVWPAAGLFELVSAGEGDESFRTHRNTEKVAAMTGDVQKISFTGAAKGKLNADIEPEEPEELDVVSGFTGMFTQEVEITAKADATNGLYEIAYDADKVSLASIRSAAKYYAFDNNEEDGVITFGYITKTGSSFSEGDVIAVLSFAADETDDGEYTVTTKQINDEHPEDDVETVKCPVKHLYGDPEFIWTETEEGVEAVLSIKCLAHTDCETNVSIEAEVEIADETPANCTYPAAIIFTATAEYDGEVYTDTYTLPYGEALPEGGHELEFVEATATCVSAGDIAHYECVYCGAIFADENAETELTAEDLAVELGDHSLQFVESTVTCSSAGETAHYECEYCGAIFADENAETELTAEDIAAEKLGHDWDEGVYLVEPSCVDNGVLLITCKNDPNHTKIEYVPSLGGHQIDEESFTEAVPATCTEDGTLAYYTCSVCGAYFADVDGEVELLSIVDPATGHDWELTETTATCTEDGVDTYTCAVCGETETVEVIAEGHKIKDAEATEPTCTEPGTIAHMYCMVCGAIFLEEDGEPVEVSEEDILVPANGHTMLKTDKKDATCTADGNIEYYTCSVCGKVYADENGETAVTSIVIPSTGHDWDEGTILSPATCTEKGLIMFACNNDPSHVVFAAIDALGHNWVLKNVVEATCTKDGSETYVCENDPAHVRTEILSATGHSMTYFEAVPATCAEDGTLAYYECANCGLKFADEAGEVELLTVVDPAKGHAWELTDSTAATCTEEGSESFKCTVCGETKTEAVPAKGHDWELTDSTAATCTEDGSNSFKCSACGETKTEAVPAAGHKLEKVEAVAPTADKEGNIEYYKCSECGKLFADAEGTKELKAEEVVIAKLDDYMLGDMNLDKEITAEDARLALRQAVKLENFAPDSINFINGDVNFDNDVTSDDARSILRAAVKLEDPATWVKK
ncbi:MAG: S8 family serine peptidase [Clostridia bacterium]|nr:S8 family serine peptidase [Clostridia bacterium]